MGWNRSHTTLGECWVCLWKKIEEAARCLPSWQKPNLASVWCVRVWPGLLQSRYVCLRYTYTDTFIPIRTNMKTNAWRLVGRYFPGSSLKHKISQSNEMQKIVVPESERQTALSGSTATADLWPRVSTGSQRVVIQASRGGTSALVLRLFPLVTVFSYFN